MCPFSRFRKAKTQNHNTVPGVMLCVIRTMRLYPAFLATHAKKLHPFGWRSLCWRYLSSRVGKVLSRRLKTCPWHILAAKKSQPFGWDFLVLALPIFPCSHPQSIVGEGVLNFCVRDGNRWTHTPINTNFNSFEHSVVPWKLNTELHSALMIGFR